MLDKQACKTVCKVLLEQLESIPLGGKVSIGLLLESSPVFLEAESAYALMGTDIRIEEQDLDELEKELWKAAEKNGFYIYEGEREEYTLYRRLRWWRLSSDMKIERIIFRSSGFLGSTELFIYDGRSLKYVELDIDLNVFRTLELNLGDRERKSFKTLLHHTNVFTWKSAYVDDEILDGTQWSFVALFSDGHAFKSYGSNAYPDEYESLYGGLLRLIVGNSVLASIAS